jgi:RNA polymerase sigma-70 factor (ECF subfamily)
VLILRDVLAWRAREVADLLGESLGSVNSLLFRARRALRDERPAPAADVDAGLLRRYIAAWEAADVDGLVALLREDARYSMPPIPAWFMGRSAITRFLLAGPLAGDAAGRWRMLETAAGGGPALATYQRTGGAYAASALSLLGGRDGLLDQVTTFLDPALVVACGLPAELDG